MSDLSSFDVDHVSFHVSSEAIIVLEARPKYDLNWEGPIQAAQRLVQAGLKILWQFDFGLEEEKFDRADETAFLSYTVAIDEFEKHLWSRFKSHTIGVSLYRGGLGFSSRHDWIDEQDFQDWAAELKLQRCDEFHRQLFCAELFAQYLHRLVSFFPEAVTPILCIDVSSCSSLGLLALLLSKERFEHVHIAVKGAKLPLSSLIWQKDGSILCAQHLDAAIAVCLPPDAACQPSILQQLEQIFSELEQSKAIYRLIPEERLAEEWNGIDQLIVISQAVSSQGKRKLLGFCAAGGEVIYAAT